MREFHFDEEKFAELILYVSEKMDGDPSFGATKLNKVLFFSDFFAYQQLGTPITGAEYQKLEHGPAPRKLLPVQRSLEEKGDAKLVVRPYLGRTQKRLVALRDAKVSVFKPDELKVVDQVIEALVGAKAVEVSRASHEVSVGWQLAGLKETIPYESVFLTRLARMNEDDVVRARELADEHKWVA
jgi:hypothetical protein